MRECVINAQLFCYHPNTGLTVDFQVPAGAESYHTNCWIMESTDESKPDNIDPPCEDGAANHGGEKEELEGATAEEDVERLAPLPFPISTRANLNSLTTGSVPKWGVYLGKLLFKWQRRFSVIIITPSETRITA